MMNLAIRFTAGLVLLCLLSFQRAEATRNREALERYEVETLTYWLYVDASCGHEAIILDSDGFVHRLRVGGYIGKNFGRVTSITPETIEYAELYQDMRGEWYERRASMYRRRSKLRETPPAGTKSECGEKWSQ